MAELKVTTPALDKAQTEIEFMSEDYGRGQVEIDIREIDSTADIIQMIKEEVDPEGTENVSVELPEELVHNIAWFKNQDGNITVGKKPGFVPDRVGKEQGKKFLEDLPGDPV